MTMRGAGLLAVPKLIADQAEMKLLHMVTSSPARTPTLTMFGNDNYFFQNGSGGACASQADCVSVGAGFRMGPLPYIQGVGRIEGRCPRNGLQADSGGRGQLAKGQRSPPGGAGGGGRDIHQRQAG